MTTLYVAVPPTTKPKLQDIPKWLVRRLKAYRKMSDLPDVAPAASELVLLATAEKLCGEKPAWLGPWGSSTRPGRTTFVSEPEHFNGDTAKSLDLFCVGLGGLHWDVTPASWWLPGQTVRITIWEP